MPILEFFNMIFEWHDPKFDVVFAKRGITLEEVASVFIDPSAVENEDIGEYGEQRKLIIGMSNQARLLVVVFTEREEVFRIITAYLPTKHQQRSYQNATRY